MTDVLVGVDLGGTSIKVAISDCDGELFVHETIPTESHEGPTPVLDRLASFLDQLIQDQTLANQCGGPPAISGLGMGLPGLVDVDSGQTKFLPNMPTKWRDVSVVEHLQERLHAPVRILNDVRMAALGELTYGHGMSQTNPTFAFFSIGTGVGGAIVIDGDLRLGPLGSAGELGHQTLDPNGPRCGCGNRGCLEALASGPAITASGIRLMASGLAPHLHQAAGGNARNVTPSLMASVAGQDAAIREALEHAYSWIGIAAANVVTMLHPDCVVLGGGVAELGEPMVRWVEQTIHDRVGMFPTDAIRVLPSALGESAGVMGAIALANLARGSSSTNRH